MRPRSLLLGAGGAALGLLGYAAGVEPYALRLVRRTLFCPRLPAEFDGCTVLQVSDLHTRQMGRRERALIALLDALPPVDLVAVTGDMIHTPRGTGPFLEIARHFRASDCVCAIFGNSEHKNGIRPHGFTRTLESNGIRALHNRHVTLTRDGASITLAGVDDPVNDRDDTRKALATAPKDRFTLLLMHSPDSVADAVAEGVDLVLSGHTHGGQVAFPLIGAPFTHSVMGPRMSSGYYAGERLRQVIGIRPGHTQLYVTRGIGVSGLALRFLCPPELTLLTLRRGAPACRG